MEYGSGLSLDYSTVENGYALDQYQIADDEYRVNLIGHDLAFWGSLWPQPGSMNELGIPGYLNATNDYF